MSSKYKTLQKTTVSQHIGRDGGSDETKNALQRSAENFDRTRKFLSEASQDKLTNKHVKYFTVDKTGLHCFIICSDAVFYANFLSDTVHEIMMTDTIDGVN